MADDLTNLSADLTNLSAEEIEARVADVRARTRPVEKQLADLRAERDVLLTELRRRERQASRERRAGIKHAMRSGDLATFAELVAHARTGSFDDYRYNLRTGGEVRLGFPGARPAVAFTDGRRTVQARDLGQAGELYAAGWELGSPGRPGIRVHFAGTRQERLVEPDDLFVRAPEGPADAGGGREAS